MNEDIGRFCEIVLEINRLNKTLIYEKAKFYYGGYSFEECYSTEVAELKSLEEEFLFLLKTLPINYVSRKI